MNNHENAGAPVIIAALVGVAEVFSGLADFLRSAQGFSDVTQQRWMSRVQRREEFSFGDDLGKGDKLEIEWYADAEHESGAALSFGMNLLLEGDEWIIGSSVSVVDRERAAHPLIELATRYAVEDDDLVHELASASSALAATQNQAILEFEKKYGSPKPV